MGKEKGQILFGLTQDYRKIAFKPKTDITDIESNVAALLSSKNLSDLRDYKLCLALIASLH